MIYLVDSNVFIDSSKPDDVIAANFLASLASEGFYFSSITAIEVLGYHSLQENDAYWFYLVFSLGTEIFITSEIKEKSIKLRQQQSMILDDSIIAASALIYNLPIATRNISDFDHIDGLELYNPYNYPQIYTV